MAALVLARASARHALRRADDAFSDAVLAAFRRELGATVRCASPLLTALLDHYGLELDALAPSLRPARGWPERPRLPASGAHPGDAGGASAWARPEAAWRARAAAFSPDDCHGLTIVDALGDSLTLHVVDHSLEVAARLGVLRLRSLFGAFRVAVPRDAWRAPAPRTGDGLDGRVSHPALGGRGWRVAAVDRGADGPDHRFSVRTGTMAYVLPWGR